MEEISTMIQTLGFPIVAVIAVAWYAKYTNDNYRTDLKETNLQHKEELKAMTDALNNNTIVLTKLCERLERSE